jgi:apolipoprotein N-acyltransferase
MTKRYKDWLLLCSSIALGLGVSTGWALGMVVAAAMPLACLAAGTRKAALRSAFGYYAAALWPMIPGLEVYWKSEPLIPLLLWIFTALLLSLPWTVAWTCHRVQYLWRAPLALLTTIVPPLGIVGLASPLMGAGYLYPGKGWVGLAAVALLPGIILSTQSLSFRARRVVIGLAAGLCIATYVSYSGDAKPPSGWMAINTDLGDVSKPFRDFAAARFIQQKAAETSARVLIFPESVVPRWSEATEAFWHQSLDRCRTRGQILAIGVGLPHKSLRNDRERLNDLRTYDFGEAIEVLKSGSTRTIHGPARSPLSERVDNALLLVGAASATFNQRVPVPVGMWRPFSKGSVPLRLNAPGVLVIDHERAAVLICYEQMLTFPILTSMLQHPTVIVGISNTFWVDHTTIPRYQANALRAWAKLFHLPYLLAVNS